MWELVKGNLPVALLAYTKQRDNAQPAGCMPFLLNNGEAICDANPQTIKWLPRYAANGRFVARTRRRWGFRADSRSILQDGTLGCKTHLTKKMWSSPAHRKNELRR